MRPLPERLASASAIGDGRRVIATDIERHLRTRFTVDTLRALQLRFPRARFVWLMGADGLRDFPRWRRWERIARTVPIAVFPRPPYNHAALAGRAAHRFASKRRRARAAHRLALAPAPAWAYLTGREMRISATELRARDGEERP